MASQYTMHHTVMASQYTMHHTVMASQYTMHHTVEFGWSCVPVYKDKQQYTKDIQVKIYFNCQNRAGKFIKQVNCHACKVHHAEAQSCANCYTSRLIT